MKIGSYGHTFENPNRSKAPWVIYHNPRCSKSREALDLLRQNRIDPEIIEYLITPLKKQELLEVIKLLKTEPKDIVRTKEKIFESLHLDLTDAEKVAEAIVEHPELLERPIVIHSGKAVIGRPSERVLELMD